MNSNDEYELDNPYGLETDSDFHKTRKDTTISLVKKYSNQTEHFRILDVGCGTGSITKLVKKSNPKAEIDAIDISDKAIEIAKKDDFGINYLTADAILYKGFGFRYDIILLNNIYEHVENPTGILINLKQLLSDDGIFIISTPNRYFIRNVIRKLFGLAIVIPKYHITEYSIGQIYDHHLYAGLKVKNVILPVFKREQFRLKDFVVFKILLPIGDNYLKFLKSRTRLGSLLFIISSK